MGAAAPEHKQQVIAWTEARDTIVRHAEDHPAAPVLIGVTGPVGAGKSTLAAMLTPCVLATDDFLPDHAETDRAVADEPAAADLGRVSEALRTLLAGRPVTVPIWSFHEHRAVGARRIEPAPIIVCEGIHAHEPPIDTLLHIRVYVEATKDVRRERWEQMALRGERGWGVEETRRFFREVAEPTFASRAEQLRRESHFLVCNP